MLRSPTGFPAILLTRLPLAEGPQAHLRAIWLHRHLAGAPFEVEGARDEVKEALEAFTRGGIERVTAHGKNIVFRLDDGRFVRHHLLMDGRWRKRTRTARALPEDAWLAFHLAQETLINLSGQLFEVLDEEGLRELLDGLGPDLMADPYPHDAVEQALAGSGRPLGVALLDQSLIAGVGNTAKSEALFIADCDPRQAGRDLGLDERQRLVEVLGGVLRESFAMGGRWRHRVYRRAGEACPRCRSQIAVIKQGGRSTYWCPSCQGGESADSPARVITSEVTDQGAHWPDGTRAPGAKETSGGSADTPGSFFLGLPAWNLPELTGTLYPEKTPASARLARYVERMTAVEGNTTFYAIPNPEVVARWAETMPPQFRFLAKVPRTISHDAPLEEAVEPTIAFLERMEPLDTRLGPLHLQLPPHFAPPLFRDLEVFLTRWNEASSHPLLVEVRHRAWFEGQARADLLHLLAEHDIGRAYMDTRPLGDRAAPEVQSAQRKPDLPVDLARTSAHAMVRYIAHPQPERNTAWIEAWAPHLTRWLVEGTTLYLFAHCPDEALAPAIARSFQSTLEAAGAGIPPLPEPPEDPRPQQLELF